MTTNGSPRRTPLYPIHVKLGARIIDFHGWEMPVQYSGIREEHFAVREKAGIFDVCHMGTVGIKGKNALKMVQKVYTGDASPMREGDIHYGLLCNENGGIIDDVTLFKVSEENYFFCVNASNVSKDYEWLKSAIGNDAEVINESETGGIIALQGPLADDILSGVSEGIDLKSIKTFKFDYGRVAGVNAIISRTGYTGERGFEFFFEREKALLIWEEIFKAGVGMGLKPAGLGARDTLRLEMKYTLYGNDIGDSVSPLEACLERYISFDKGDFIGHDALLKEKESGSKRRLAGFRMIDLGIPRQGFEIMIDGMVIGYVTSGGHSFSTENNIGMALVDTKHSVVGTQFFVSVRGKELKAEVVETPFYKRKK